MKEFKAVLEKELRSMIEAQQEIHFLHVTKINDVVLEGLYISEKGHNISPVVYLEPFFEKYQSGISVTYIAADLMQMIKNNEIADSKDYSTVKDLFTSSYEQIKDNIVFRIINTERNKAFLSDKPHRELLDLSVMYYIPLVFGKATTTISITNAHMQFWGISEEDLYMTAVKNTTQKLPAKLHTMQEIINCPGFTASNSKLEMYILTNNTKWFGAAVIFYPDVLQNIFKDSGPIYICPSSIHEVIVVPCCFGLEEGLKQIIPTINVSYVGKEDFLSDNLYKYTKEEGLQIVKS